MKNSPILICFSRILYPFVLVFGFYVIVNGHLTPGGGFQGGAILATAILITYLIDPDRIEVLERLIRYEKWLFIGIVLSASISFLSKGVFFTNPAPLAAGLAAKRVFLVLLNVLIGVKVSLGLVTIFASFVEEGRQAS